MFPGHFKSHFLILMLLLGDIMLGFFYFAGKTSLWETLVKTGLKAGEIKNLVKKCKLIAS